MRWLCSLAHRCACLDELLSTLLAFTLSVLARYGAAGSLGTGDFPGLLAAKTAFCLMIRT